MLADILVKVAGMGKESRGKYRPRPSLCGPERCIRQLVYWAANTPEDKEIADRFILTMDDSSWHETLTTDWISKTAFQFHSSQLPLEVSAVPFAEDISFLNAYHCDVCGQSVMSGYLHGHIDGIITDVLGEEYLFEHKALNHFSFNRYADGETFPMDYIAQSCIYVRGAQYFNSKIVKALLLIKNKNTAQYLEMVIHYDKDKDAATIYEVTISTGDVRVNADGSPLLVIKNVVGDAVRKLEQVDTCIKKKTLPPRPYDYGTSFPCGYCSWEETCWANYIHEINALGKNEADLTEIADTARFYNELGAQMSTMKTQRDEIGQALKDKLTELQARKGRAGEYVVDWQIQEVEKVMAKDEIPPEIRPKVMKKDIREVLYVKKFKPKKEKSK